MRTISKKTQIGLMASLIRRRYPTAELTDLASVIDDALESMGLGVDPMHETLEPLVQVSKGGDES
jgi:hypothetical protein